MDIDWTFRLGRFYLDICAIEWGEIGLGLSLSLGEGSSWGRHISSKRAYPTSLDQRVGADQEPIRNGANVRGGEIPRALQHLVCHGAIHIQ